LPGFLPRQRWFGSKARQIHAVSLADCIPIRLSQTTALLTLARVEYNEGSGETYVLPLLPGDESPVSAPDSSENVLRIPKPESTAELPFKDALGNSEFLSAILDSISRAVSHAGESGECRAVPEQSFRRLSIGASETLSPRVMKGEQSNTSVVYGDRLILKFFRRIEEGINPDLEIGQFLTQIAQFKNAPPLYGSLLYRSPEGKDMTLGILQGFVPCRGDAWRFTTESLQALFSSAQHSEWKNLSPRKNLSQVLCDDDLPKELSDRLTEQLNLMGLLGKRTAELHLALVASRSDAAFAPEPFTPRARETLESELHDMTVRNFELLRRKIPELPESLTAQAKKVLKLEEDVLLAFHSGLENEFRCVRTRIHGDYHLGQVLFTGSDFFVIDFEGEPAKPLSERRSKRSPLQDVAGMLRSFHYAARAALLAVSERKEESNTLDQAVVELAALWQSLASHQFLIEYKKTASTSPFLPATPTEFDRLLKLHLLEKAVYELGYELNNRPAWLAIPLGGIEETLTAKTF
jgi:maltose alpha-D-glucosyltransferase / alpha-amylase